MKKLNLLVILCILFFAACQEDTTTVEDDNQDMSESPDDDNKDDEDVVSDILYQGDWKGEGDLLNQETVFFTVENINGQSILTKLSVQTTGGFSIISDSITSISNDEFSYTRLSNDNDTRTEVVAKLSDTKIEGQDVFEGVVKIFYKSGNDFVLDDEFSFKTFRGRWIGATIEENEVVLDMHMVDGEPKLFFFWLRQMELTDIPYFEFFDFNLEQEGLTSIEDNQFVYNVSDIGFNKDIKVELSGEIKEGDSVDGKIVVFKVEASTGDSTIEIGRTSYSVSLSTND